MLTPPAKPSLMGFSPRPPPPSTTKTMGQDYDTKTYETQLISLAQVLQVFHTETDVGLLLKTTLDFLNQEFHYPLVWLAVYDAVDHQLVGKVGNSPLNNPELITQTIPLNTADLLEQVVIQQRPVGISDLRQETRVGPLCDWAQQCNIQGSLLFPLRSKNRCFGLILLGHFHRNVNPPAADKAQLSLVLGGLATAFYQLELEWQRSLLKHPERPLFHLLEESTTDHSFTTYLEVAVAETHKFIQPEHTNIYWYSPKKRYFWHRVGHQEPSQSVGNVRKLPAGIKVADVPDFYERLAQGQLIYIGEGCSPLEASSTKRLMARLHTRSLLAAPIVCQGEVIGFLSVEAEEARIWDGAEKKYVQGTAQLLGLVVGNEETREKVQAAAQSSKFATELSTITHEDPQDPQSLNKVARLICQQLKVNRLLLLTQAPPGDHYDVVYQYRTSNQGSFLGKFPALTAEQWQRWGGLRGDLLLLEDADSGDFPQPWQETLQNNSMRSLLGHGITQEETQTVVLVSQDQARTWQQWEQDILQLAGTHLIWLFHHQQLRHRLQNLHLHNQIFVEGVQKIWELSTQDIHWQHQVLEYVAQLLKLPVAMLFSWEDQPPDSPPRAHLIAHAAKEGTVIFPRKMMISLKDPLIQHSVKGAGFYERCLEDLSPESQEWLQGQIQLLTEKFQGTVLAIALRPTDSTPPATMAVFVGLESQQFTPEQLAVVEKLLRHFAWIRLYRRHDARQGYRQPQTYQLLNWYKHLCLDVFHQSVTASIGALLAIETKLEQQLGETNSLRRMRQQQLMRQLEETMTILIPVLTEEKSQIIPHFCSVPLTNLLKRSLRLLESLYKQRKIMLKVNNFGNFNIYSDPIKLECILFNLLVFACNRTRAGGTIEVQSHLLEQKLAPDQDQEKSFIELVIVERQVGTKAIASQDQGTKDKIQRFEDLEMYESDNPDLKICQQLLQSLKGELYFYQEDNGNFYSRLLLLKG